MQPVRGDGCTLSGVLDIGCNLSGVLGVAYQACRMCPDIVSRHRIGSWSAKTSVRVGLFIEYSSTTVVGYCGRLLWCSISNSTTVVVAVIVLL